MTVSSQVVDTSSFGSTAKLRAWGSAISACLVASGLTVTADTGQVNWTTVTWSNATNTKMGYEVYRFNDTLQATSPIYFRIDYGTGGSSSNPSTWLTVGTGSDGAGNITGTAAGMASTSNNFQTTANTNANNTVGASYSTSAGACSILCGQLDGVANRYGAWVVGRSCDTSGNPTSTATIVYRVQAAIATTIVCNLLSPATNFASRSVGAANFSPAVTITAGTTVAVHKNYIIAPTPIPTLAAVTINNGDSLLWANLSVAAFGATPHNYLNLAAFATGFDSQQSANSVACLIWE